MKIYWSDGSRIFSNVMHGTHGGSVAVNETLAESLFAAFKAAMTTSGWGAQVHASVSMYRVGVKDLSAAYMPEYLSSGAVMPGTAAGGPLSDATAVAVTQQTNRSGAQWRGRTFLGGLAVGATTDGHTIEDATATAAGAFMESVRSAMSSNQLPMCVAQVALDAGQTAGGADLPPRAANSVPVTRCVVSDNRLDTQRRRLGR